ncbi:DUF2214 family protein [Fulvivirga sp. RKSG066]|uniref:DUF2214 family protein n=1 Tax=Fulvivirga aurantia TaxID=2529383 RepID=UPI0012BBF77D|nr:DUF2214 family protein [Fulvivirga aurantia]MTI20889.1 DUF2214 family protein [Fulvivirga aurantia]
MTELILTRYIHFLGIMIVFAMVVVEFVLIQKQVSRKLVKKLFVIDGIYGLSSLIVVAAGLYLWFGTGKPEAYYNQNGLFHAKVGLFVLVGILSLWPTVFYFKNRKGASDDVITIPSRIKKIVLVELVLLIIIPVLATLMAQGVGL